MQSIVRDAETGELIDLQIKTKKIEANEFSNKEKIQAQKDTNKRTIMHLKRKQQEYLCVVIQEEIDAEKQREFQMLTEGKLPETRRILKAKFARDRIAAKDKVERIIQENEIIVASKMVELNFIR